MKFIFSIILAFSFQLIFAQADGPYTSNYDTGILKSSGQYKNKKRVGEWKFYYENGLISGVYFYNNGKRQEFTSYFEDGSVKSETKKIGNKFINKKYYKTGSVKSESEERTGYYKAFFETGELQVESTYKDYELVGEWKKYYKNGKIKWLVNYKDDYREGVYKNFYENGDLKLEGSNKDDKKNGEEKRYLKDGVLEFKGQYKNDELIKTWIKYNLNGEPDFQIKFRNGVPKNNNGLILEPTRVASGIYETFPIFSNCEKLISNKQMKKCFSSSVAEFVTKKFSKKLIDKINLIGTQRINILFKVDKTGELIDIKAKAKFIELEEEAIRIIKELPKLKPGIQYGKPVIVPFTLPLVIQAQKKN